MSDFTITREQVTGIHNGLCEFSTLIDELEDILHPTFLKRLREAKCNVAKGLKPVRDQVYNEWDSKHQYFSDVRDSRQYKSIWSIYEITNLYHYSGLEVGEAAVLEYGNCLVSLPAGKLTWMQLWEAAEQVIIKSNDIHHLFIERFTQSSFNPNVIFLDTGS